MRWVRPLVAAACLLVAGSSPGGIETIEGPPVATDAGTAPITAPIGFDEDETDPAPDADGVEHGTASEDVSWAAGEGAGISGRVTSERGEPLQAQVTAYRREGGYNRRLGTSTDALGRFKFEHLEPGGYHIEFHGTDYSLGEWYDDQPSFDEDSVRLISVGAGQWVDGIDAVLAPAGRIAGRVTDEAGRPVRQCVLAAAPDGHGETGWYTNDDGTYIIGGIEPGPTIVWFVDNCPGDVSWDDEHEIWDMDRYRDEWYDDAIDQRDATIVKVVAERTIQEVDAVLSLRKRPDLAVTGVSARTDPVVASITYVDVALVNHGPVKTIGDWLVIEVCQEGSCERLGRFRVSVEGGASETFTYEWRDPTMVGTVTIIATAETLDDSDRTNNRASTQHEILADASP